MLSPLSASVYCYLLWVVAIYLFDDYFKHFVQHPYSFHTWPLQEVFHQLIGGLLFACQLAQLELKQRRQRGKGRRYLPILTDGCSTRVLLRCLSRLFISSSYHPFLPKGQPQFKGQDLLGSWFSPAHVSSIGHLGAFLNPPIQVRALESFISSGASALSLFFPRHSGLSNASPTPIISFIEWWQGHAFKRFQGTLPGSGQQGTALKHHSPRPRIRPLSFPLTPVGVTKAGSPLWGLH